MSAPVLQVRRGNAGVAGTVPALRPGEPAFSLNNFDFYIGLDTSVSGNKFFGSHRYWGRENGTTALKLKLVDKDGSNSINLKSPDTLAGITTYTLPETPTNGYLLTTNASGDLSWTNSLPELSISGVTTFTNTTDNTLGDADTGAVQIDGGLGINKNLTVGANLHVQGYSNFVGVVTFQGGTINLGDDTGDNINVGGEFTSGLYPNATNTYDLGDGTRQWRHANFAGIGTFSTGAVADAVQIGISATNKLDTSSGNLILDSADGTIDIQDNLTVSGFTTITGDLAVNGGDVTTSATTFNLVNGTATSVNFGGAATSLVMGASTGITTISNNLTVGGDIRVNGNDIQASDGNTNITLTSNTLTEIKGDLQVTGNDIKSSTGDNALTLSGSNVTVNGNLYVNGTTTQVNTGTITVEDRTIELGRVDGNAPSSATTWDLGILFNYNSSGSKKSAVVWEHGDSRFKFASVLDSDTDGTDNDTPQLTVTTFAPIEVSALWVTDCAGTSQVISCTGSERFLENITVDAGTF